MSQATVTPEESMEVMNRGRSNALQEDEKDFLESQQAGAGLRGSVQVDRVGLRSRTHRTPVHGSEK